MKPLITFVANAESKGDGTRPETMDWYGGLQYPWLSLAIPKLRERGYDVEVVDWRDSSIDWENKQLLVTGPVWGYWDHKEEFAAWLERIQAFHVPMANSAPFVRWNMNKSYLADLEKNGIAVPPTRIISSDSTETLAETVVRAKSDWQTEDIIIKGTVDAGAYGYRHIKPGTTAIHAAQFEALKKNNDGAVVQAFLPEINRGGEFSFVFFGDHLSHGYLKAPVANEERVQPLYGGRIFLFTNGDIADRAALQKFRPDIRIPRDEIAAAETQAIETRRKLSNLLHKKGITPPLYVRIDGALVNGQLQVMEIEGIEPYMGFDQVKHTDAVGSYVSAIEAAYQNRLLHKDSRSAQAGR